MPMRSWLFAPGDSEKKLAKLPETGADVVILDLEDAVATEAKPNARELTRRWLEAHRTQVVQGERQQHWVRINALDTPDWKEDLVAAMSGAPDGIMIPKATGPEVLPNLAAEIYELEQKHGIPNNTTKLLPLVSETPAAALRIPEYVGAAAPRLLGLTWGAEDLSAALGATRKRTEGGGWSDTFRLVRSTVLLTAHARECLAIDTLYADFRDLEGLQRAAAESRADGFGGMLAIHPAQVPVINAAFTPSEAELTEARAVVAAFAADPGSGAVSLDGKMLDQPHFKQARRLLGLD
jgi:citrate lyase subunit beta / citryl-CoA lyase